MFPEAAPRPVHLFLSCPTCSICDDARPKSTRFPPRLAAVPVPIIPVPKTPPQPTKELTGLVPDPRRTMLSPAHSPSTRAHSPARCHSKACWSAISSPAKSLDLRPTAFDRSLSEGCWDPHQAQVPNTLRETLGIIKLTPRRAPHAGEEIADRHAWERHHAGERARVEGECVGESIVLLGSGISPVSSLVGWGGVFGPGIIGPGTVASRGGNLVDLGRASSQMEQAGQLRNKCTGRGAAS
ncbi:hypothetical protein Drorol1_Dr00017923 [Drosera rotundifolia]